MMILPLVTTTRKGRPLDRTGPYGKRAVVGSIRLEARELDHLAPLLGVVGDEFAKVARRAWKHGAAQIGKTSVIFGSPRAALISLLSFSRISTGVFLGAPTPYH